MTDILPTVDLNARLETQTPFEILEYAIDNFADLAISFSGAEDIVLVHMAKQIDPQIQVFSLDTGRLHPETYRYLEEVRNHYKLNLEILFPDAGQVQQLVSSKGLFSFYEDNHQECCGIRKILPLQRKLSGLDAWVTGQRKDQSPGTRAAIPVIQADKHFSGEGRELVKFNPLANWSSRAVWDYIRAHNLPYNPLHDRGYISIGCEPCTRPVGPNQHEREGRWWWEEATKKECGLHASNIDKA